MSALEHAARNEIDRLEDVYNIGSVKPLVVIHGGGVKSSGDKRTYGGMYLPYRAGRWDDEIHIGYCKDGYDNWSEENVRQVACHEYGHMILCRVKEFAAAWRGWGSGARQRNIATMAIARMKLQASDSKKAAYDGRNRGHRLWTILKSDYYWRNERETFAETFAFLLQCVFRSTDDGKALEIGEIISRAGQVFGDDSRDIARLLTAVSGVCHCYQEIQRAGWHYSLENGWWR